MFLLVLCACLYSFVVFVFDCSFSELCFVVALCVFMSFVCRVVFFVGC